MARYLGIEVSEAQVKGVVLRTAYRSLTVEGVYRVGRAPGFEGIIESAAWIVRQAGAGLDGIYAALPGWEVSLRQLELPRAVWKRGGRVVATELEGQLPYEIEDATVDALPIRTGETMDLLAVSARTERVKAFLDALRAGNAEPREIAVAPLALAELVTALPVLQNAGPIMVVHAYETHAEVVILSGGTLVFARSLSGQTTPAVRSRSFRQTLGAWIASGGAAPERAYLCGEAAEQCLEPLLEATELPQENVGWLPLDGIALLPSVEPIEVLVSPVALAVALRGMGRSTRVDLRKGPLAVVGSAQVLRERGWLLAGLAAAMLSSWTFATYSQYQSIAQERDRLREALGTVTMEVFNERITDPSRAKTMAQGRGQEEVDPQPLADAFDVVGVLSTRIPESIRHDIAQLDVQEERVEVNGLVDSLAHRDQIVEALTQYDCFETVRPGRVQRNPGDDRQQYTLEIQLRCPERRQAAERRNNTQRTQGGAGNGGGA